MKHLQGKRAILYRRVSTTEQTLGNSLNAQQDELRFFCKKHKIIIVQEYAEDYSAKNFNRPEFNKLLQYAVINKNNIDYLLIHRWDRFSRNSLEALSTINDFKSLGIEVNSIIQWINHDNPSELLSLLINLGLPEIDNRQRSDRVKEGNRQALKEGRYIYSVPKGYIRAHDIFGKTYIKPHVDMGPLITELFSDFSTGQYSQRELIKLTKYKGLELTKSRLSKILKNIIYTGKIKLPKYKEESNRIIDGKHTPLITEQIFRKVQEQLNQRNRYKGKLPKNNTHFVLKRFLKCDKCGDTMTGSRSKSSNGNHYYYYHCQPKNKCGNRIPIHEADNQFINYLKMIKPTEEVCNLFQEVFRKYIENRKFKSFEKVKILKKEIKKIEERKSSLTEKLIEKIVDDKTYKKLCKKYDRGILEREEELKSLSNNSSKIETYVDFGIKLLKNIDKCYQASSYNLKSKILSSILAKKMVFSNSKYRTIEFNDGFNYIYHKIKHLKKINNNKKGKRKEIVFRTQGGT